MILANLRTSGLKAVVAAPVSRAKFTQAASLTSAPINCLLVERPARIKPLARAVAILPAPRKPMVKLEAIASCSRGREVSEVKSRIRRLTAPQISEPSLTPVFGQRGLLLINFAITIRDCERRPEFQERD